MWHNCRICSATSLGHAWWVFGFNVYGTQQSGRLSAGCLIVVAASAAAATSLDPTNAEVGSPTLAHRQQHNSSPTGNGTNAVAVAGVQGSRLVR
jgi:hypothetical protein